MESIVYFEEWQLLGLGLTAQPDGQQPTQEEEVNNG